MSGEYGEAERKIMREATHCLCCGVRLKYLQRKEARRNQGYCSLRCFYRRTPKMVRVQREFGGDVAELLTGWLNDGLSQAEIARTCDVSEWTIMQWLRKLGIRRVTRWEVSA